ncbi:hypothetical protein BAUCODRAFT_68592 [Baudoinia panamericana UAMH 10762]|uniref:Histone chaperone RTT106/FACT complex subunit SPT16-like middle domain-containing protein n=1 Tax=Baudoinia panamericana (strain UAMH 10762) TaxID=717646 RepID=M2MKJ1_BAUPA|nr:uncharacterized protein BAUCODRAFT_68592 [Baudoinia panamericana UAMH 10762]EMC97211.1 hypothetical protein BAUCODRAFT_68592 [Baudoinia panamericana UAMH 10762]
MEQIQATFPPPITQRIVQAIRRHPDQAELLALFSDIARLTTSSQTVVAPAHGKKRKLEDAPPNACDNDGITTSKPLGSPTISFECKDVSFQVPARKKLRLQFVYDAHDRRKQEIRLQNQQSSVIEHALPAGQISEVFCLPVPEKQQRQWNFVLFPKPDATAADGTPCEQIVFSMNETPPTGAHSAEQQFAEGDTFVTVAERELNRLLSHQGKRVVVPDPSEFASSIPQSHRKGEKAYHVKAHRGSKEGYLFFLSNGVVFGFKKPLAYFPFNGIDSVSYTSVLQRTFNLVIAARESEQSDIKEVEFSMLDQADFAGIDEYVKRHGLNDASMAAERRAKAFNVNKEKKSEAHGESNGDAAHDEEGESELHKAEQQLQDEEDELEEDYEASGGESDGEGEESDEEEEYSDAADEDDAEDAEHEEDV